MSAIHILAAIQTNRRFKRPLIELFEFATDNPAEVELSIKRYRPKAILLSLKKIQIIEEVQL